MCQSGDNVNKNCAIRNGDCAYRVMKAANLARDIRIETSRSCHRPRDQFGVWTVASQANSPRYIQLGARLVCRRRAATAHFCRSLEVRTRRRGRLRHVSEHGPDREFLLPRVRSSRVFARRRVRIDAGRVKAIGCAVLIELCVIENVGSLPANSEAEPFTHHDLYGAPISEMASIFGLTNIVVSALSTL
jgi:hypothetical protein